MTLPSLSLPSDLASAHAALLAERAARIEAEAANAKARLSSIEALAALVFFVSFVSALIGQLVRVPFGGPRR